MKKSDKNDNNNDTHDNKQYKVVTKHENNHYKNGDNK